jgi:hypothetical protein
LCCFYARMLGGQVSDFHCPKLEQLQQAQKPKVA